MARSRGEVLELVNRIAPEHLATDDEWVVAQRPLAGTVFVGAWAPPAAGDYATGSNHVLPTAGAARFRGGLNAADFVRVVAVQRLTRAGLRGIAGRGHHHGRRRGADRARRVHRREAAMSTGYLYEPLPDIGAGLRLHLNENTGGCSPAVLEAIARLTREDIAVYPAYERATEGLRRALGV